MNPIDHKSITGLVLCGLMYEPVALVLSLLGMARSRRNELEADRFAVETTGLSGALVSGLKRMAGDSLSNLSPHPSYVFVHYTHPPLGLRIRAIQGVAAETAQAPRAAAAASG